MAYETRTHDNLFEEIISFLSQNKHEPKNSKRNHLRRWRRSKWMIELSNHPSYEINVNSNQIRYHKTKRITNKFEHQFGIDFY